MDTQLPRLGESRRYPTEIRTLTDFDISFDPPKFGWLPVTIQIEGQSFTFGASDVLNDPVSELVEAVSHLLGGPCTDIIGFWLEPPWHLLELTSDGGGRTSIAFSHRTDDNKRNAEFKLTTSFNTLRLCRLILNRLRSMHAATGTDQYPTPQCWGMEFPGDNISAAFEQIREKSGG